MNPLECQLQDIAIQATSYRGKQPGNTLEEEIPNGLVTLSASDQRNAYQERAPPEAKSAVRPYNVFWHLYQVLSVGDPIETALAGPWVACQKMGRQCGHHLRHRNVWKCNSLEGRRTALSQESAEVQNGSSTKGFNVLEKCMKTWIKGSLFSVCLTYL